MKNKYIALLFLAASTLYTSCTSKLDELPDKRMTLRTPSDVKRLLVTAYPEYKCRLCRRSYGFI